MGQALAKPLTSPVDFHSMGPAEREKLMAMLAEAARRRRLRLIHTMFPDEGIYRRELYPKHVEFFASRQEPANDEKPFNLTLTAEAVQNIGERPLCSERIFMAGNRVGKTMAAGTELSYHLTGQYPEWWVGHRFSKPIRAMCSGDTHETTRDILQIKLLGGTSDKPETWGTGLIPGEAIVNVVARAHVKGAVEKIVVKHYDEDGKCDGESELWMRSYEQGREIFQGFELDVFWADEECPQDVYEEALVRLMTRDGISMLTFTPLNGLTPLVQELTKPASDYSDEEDPDGLKREAANDRLVIRCGWDDVPHLSEKQKAKLLAKLAPHQRLARTKGVPSLGSGAIYPVAEEEITCAPFLFPAYWKHGYGMDVGWNRTAVVWGAYDEENDTIYAHAEHYQGQAEPSIHAAAIKARGAWKPGAIDPAARGRSQIDGEQLLTLYQGLDLDITPALNGVEAGLYEVLERLSTGRLKIFTTMRKTLGEYRIYRRDDKGKVVKVDDHAMDALRYLVMFFVHQAGGKVKPVGKAKTAKSGGNWRTA